jgi:hypothetical protein
VLCLSIVDVDFLNDVGIDGFIYASNAIVLSRAILDIVINIQDEASNDYVFELCSPARSGTHVLEVCFHHTTLCHSNNEHRASIIDNRRLVWCHRRVAFVLVLHMMLVDSLLIPRPGYHLPDMACIHNSWVYVWMW